LTGTDDDGYHRFRKRNSRQRIPGRGDCSRDGETDSEPFAVEVPADNSIPAPSERQAMNIDLGILAVALSYGVTCGAVVFVAGLKMIGADDHADLFARAIERIDAGDAR
jgi:hypothetical protein